MTRIGVLLVLFGIGQVHAETASSGKFNYDHLDAVYNEALSFIAPRILAPVPVSRLTIWGLQGVIASDHDLRMTESGTNLRLFHHNQMVADVMTPKSESPAAWAQAATAVTMTSGAVSARVRRGGPIGVLQAFFGQMFSRLDPYSRYVPPDEADEDRAQRTGRADIGLTLERRGPLIEVRSVTNDSPAAAAGIKPGDILAAIDGRRSHGKDLIIQRSLLSGAEGSAVTLAWHGRDGRGRNARLIRIMVPPKTVFAEHLANILLLRVASFSADTAAHLAQSVRDELALPHPMDGIVLDLRGNRGGLLRQAAAAANSFLPPGVIATTVGRNPDAHTIWRSTAGELAENVPLVILVDGATASAAEIFAAALADRGRAVVVGSVTVGKGMVQTIDPLSDGGELFVTWSETLAPLGWAIQGTGVLPQVCTSLGQAALERQLAALEAGRQPMAEAIRRSRAVRLPQTEPDVLRTRAACPASTRPAADIQAARRVIANPAAYAAALLPSMQER